MDINKITFSSKQTGFGLIEVLVSVLVLAIGLLGVAGLQAQSIRFNHEAYLRTQATVLASDMIDRMRANRNEALDTDNYKISFTDSPTASATACETNACSANQIAAYDFTQWRANIADALPNGKGDITPLAKGSNTWREYVIKIQYDSVSSVAGSSSPSTIILEYKTRI